MAWRSGKELTVWMSYEVFHRDVSVLVDFYVRVMGFTLTGDRVDADYTMVVRDEVRIGCCRHSGAQPALHRPPVGSEIVLHVDSVDTEYGRVVHSEWPVADPLQVRPWGMTDFRLFDPTGQYLRITGPRASS
jgi:predicted enzyme related to lactoylglutathione lyase